MRTLTDHFQSKGIPLVSITKDEAKSGKTIARDGLQEALGYIRRGEANLLAVCKLDRATRDAFEAFGLERELRSLGASLYCIEANIDTSDPNARLMFGIHAVMTQRYRENLAFETAKGKKARALAGLANGDPEYGYRRATAADLPDPVGDAEAVQKALRRMPYIQVPERAHAVELAFELYATGNYSDAAIARELNQRGYRMVSKRHPEGYPFTKDTITALLQNPFYYGLVSYDGLRTHGRLDLRLRRRHGKTIYATENGKAKLGQHEPIVSQELFDRVQAVRARKHRAGKTAAQCRRVYLASALAHCTVCQQPLRANETGYRDASRERGIPCAAHRRSIPTAQVDAALAAYISAIKLPDDWQAEVLQVATGRDAAARTADKRTTLLRRLERLEELQYDPDTHLADWRARKAKLEAELAALEQEGVPGASVVERAAAFLQDLSAVWAAATEEERRQLVAAMVEAVWCNLDKKRVEAIQFKDFLYPVRGVLPPQLAWSGTGGIRVPITPHRPLSGMNPSWQSCRPSRETCTAA
jgi:site-specific DNA recombinase